MQETDTAIRLVLGNSPYLQDRLATYAADAAAKAADRADRDGLPPTDHDPDRYDAAQAFCEDVLEPVLADGWQATEDGGMPVPTDVATALISEILPSGNEWWIVDTVYELMEGLA